MQDLFVGRTKEIENLRALSQRHSASLVVIKGRRRIGKSRLAEEFVSKNQKFFCFSGMPPTEDITSTHQKEEFVRQLQQQFSFPALKAEDWGDLFTVLANQVKGKRVVILFDEISWMAHKDPTFLSKLKIAWDTLFSKNPQLILILCGSVSSWIEKNILNSTGFLGRITLTIHLKELSLLESSELLDKIGFKGSLMEKFMILAVTGGVPRYLELIQASKSAENNIKSLCFEPDGTLVSEFNHIFHDLFLSTAKVYQDIVVALTTSALEYTEIAETIGYASGGPLSEYLDTLIACGFITRNFTWSIKSDKESKLSKYRLSDNYLRFYLKYIEPSLNKINKGQLANIALTSLPGWESILGLQFENIVLNNREMIWKKLGLNPEEIVSDNPYFQRKTKMQQGCQIDYLIQTKYNTLFACEIKFTRQEVGLNIVKSMKDKLDNLVLPKRCACFPVLIHVNGVSSELEDTQYFSKIIDFGGLISTQ